MGKVKKDPVIRTYLGNKKLKAADVKMKYEQWQINEIIKCKKDPIYFIENYFYITNLDNGRVLMKLYPFQKDMVHNFINNRFSINCLARQMGKSSITVAYFCWFLIFNKHKSVAVIANKHNLAKSILSRMMKAIEDLPMWIKPGVRTWNKTDFEFDNGSIGVSSATGGTSIRGESFSCIFLDELSWVDSAEEFYASVFPVVSSSKTAKVIITSTPNGKNNLFYILWNKALKSAAEAKATGERNYGYVPYKAIWSDHPERDETFKKEQLATMTLEKFEVEFECEFKGAQGALISAATLDRLEWLDTPEEFGETKIYEYPKPGSIYVGVADVAHGLGPGINKLQDEVAAEGDDYDSSTLSIIDVSKIPYRQVACYRNDGIDPTNFAYVVQAIGQLYNDAHVLIEANAGGKGDITAQVLWEDIEYENLILTEQKFEFGVTHNKATKNTGCIELKRLLEMNQLELNDRQTILELYGFANDGNGSFKAVKGKGSHDDMVMGLVTFGWLTKQKHIFENIIRPDLIGKLESYHNKQMENSYLPFGTIMDGLEITEEGGKVLLEQNDDILFYHNNY